MRNTDKIFNFSDFYYTFGTNYWCESPHAKYDSKMFLPPCDGLLSHARQNKTKKTEQTVERANNLYANADG